MFAVAAVILICSNVQMAIFCALTVSYAGAFSIFFAYYIYGEELCTIPLVRFSWFS